MSKKRLSLQSILDEERNQSEERVETAAKPSRKSSSRTKPPPTPAPKDDKSDFIRLSITISPDDFERLQAESMTRRRERETYTFSHLARIAIGEWLDKIERDREKKRK